MNIVLYKIVCHLGNIKDIELLKHKKVISGFSVLRIDSTRCSLFCQTQDQLRLFLVCGNYFLVCGNYCLFCMFSNNDGVLLHFSMALQQRRPTGPSYLRSGRSSSRPSSEPLFRVPVYVSFFRYRWMSYFDIIVSRIFLLHSTTLHQWNLFESSGVRLDPT